jgi:hypothetical protein
MIAYSTIALFLEFPFPVIMNTIITFEFGFCHFTGWDVWLQAVVWLYFQPAPGEKAEFFPVQPQQEFWWNN